MDISWKTPFLTLYDFFFFPKPFSSPRIRRLILARCMKMTIPPISSAMEASKYGCGYLPIRRIINTATGKVTAAAIDPTETYFVSSVPMRNAAKQKDVYKRQLLFLPAKAPYNYYTKDFEKGLQLYSNGVLIMDKCADLLPDYFSFVKGLVDSEDLSLNISREMPVSYTHLPSRYLHAEPPFHTPRNFLPFSAVSYTHLEVYKRQGQ